MRSGLVLPGERDGVRTQRVIAVRLFSFVFCAFVLTGCGRRSVEGVYYDAQNPAVRYELREGGSWSAELIVDVPAGIFPH